MQSVFDTAQKVEEILRGMPDARVVELVNDIYDMGMFGAEDILPGHHIYMSETKLPNGQTLPVFVKMLKDKDILAVGYMLSQVVDFQALAKDLTKHWCIVGLKMVQKAASGEVQLSDIIK